MKKKKAILRTLLALSLLTLISCGENSSTLSNKDFEGLKLSPETKRVDFNENGEAVIELDPVTPEQWEDPAFQKLEEEIRRSRKARVRAKLAEIKDERIDFTHPILTLKNNGQKQIDIKVKFKNEKSTITFLSPEKHEQDFFFKYTSGFDQRKVSLQGMCLDENEETCEVLAVQVAYIVDKTKYTEQFVLDIGQVTLDEEKKETADQSKKDEDLKRIDEPKATDEKAPSSEISAKERETYIPSSLPDLKKEEPRPISAKERETYIPNSLPDLPKKEEKALEGMSAKERETYIPSSLPDLKKEDAKPISAKERETYIPSSLPDLPKEEKEKEKEEEEEENKELNELKNVPIPTQDPRKKHLHEDDPALTVGSGQLKFKRLKEENAKKVKEEFNVQTGETTKIIKKPAAPTKPDKALLHQIRYKEYNQSRGYYTKGWIKRATQLERRLKGAVPNPNRKSRQYASGLMTSFLKYSGEKFSRKYSDSPICINNLSLKKGGKFGGHASHQNGLDADISYPGRSNKCDGAYLIDFDILKAKDSKFYKKNLDFLNIMLNTNRVEIIFTDNNFINGLCKYMKKKKASKKARKRIFTRLSHADGHVNHYHVRLKCTDQNKGCKTYGYNPENECK